MTFSIGFDTSALDPAFKAHAGRGIGRYVQELAKVIERSSPEGISIGAFDYRSFALPKLLDRALVNLPLGRQTVRQQLFYPIQLKSGFMSRFDALHFPAHMDAPSWSVKPYALTVLDLIPLLFRELYERGKSGLRFRFARFLEIRAIKSASLILAISECTARDVTRLLGVPPERIVVTPLGVDDRFFTPIPPERGARARDALEIPEEQPIVLYVGGIDARKNMKGLLDAFQHTLLGRRERGKPLPTLVVAGKIQNDDNYPELLSLIRDRALQDFVRMPGYVPDEELLALYSVASAFLFPSLYEGFGLPPLEAMAAGVPVVSSNASAMPEVLGEAALLFDPVRSEEAGRLVLDALEEPTLAESLRRRGPEQARRFSWERTGSLTLEAYERLGRSLGRR